MKARRITALACALGIAVGATACGGDSATVTVTTDQLPTTAPTTSDSTTATTLSTPETQSTDTTADLPDLALRERLPPADANPDATAGTVRDIATASELTAALYSPGDPAATPAAEKLDAAGFAGAVLRDDKGDNPATGLALFRSYVIELGSPEAAVEESDRSVQEVSDTTILDTENFSVPIPDARGVAASGSQSGQELAVEFIAFPLGPYVYGIQAVAAGSNGIDRARMLDIAQQLYDAGSAGD